MEQKESDQQKHLEQMDSHMDKLTQLEKENEAKDIEIEEHQR
jgi:hypothetical protein